MTRQVKLTQKPPIEDPRHEKEIFASDIAGAGLVHGNVVVTLTSLRADEPAGSGQATLRNIVVGRLVLTTVAAGQLLRHLQSLSARIATTEAAANTMPN
jgi:hypothetical protein